MGGEIFINLADCGNLFEIAVHHLIGRDRKEDAFLGCLFIPLIFFEDCSRYIQQRNIADLASLLPMFANPQVASIVADNVLGGQGNRIKIWP